MRKISSAVLPIIALNILVFILQTALGDRFTYEFMLVSSRAFTHPWILLTSMFLHADLNHIFFNMYGLLIFGPILEQRIGPKRFVLIYLLSGVIAALVSIFFYSAALGASGAIMGMLGTLIILMPDLRLLFFFVIPMPLWLAGVFWAIIDIFGLFMPSGVANIAHLAGMACGLLYGLMLNKKKTEFHSKFLKKSHLDEDDIEEYLKTGRI